MALIRGLTFVEGRGWIPNGSDQNDPTTDPGGNANATGQSVFGSRPTSTFTDANAPGGQRSSDLLGSVNTRLQSDIESGSFGYDDQIDYTDPSTGESSKKSLFNYYSDEASKNIKRQVADTREQDMESLNALGLLRSGDLVNRRSDVIEGADEKFRQYQNELSADEVRVRQAAREAAINQALATEQAFQGRDTTELQMADLLQTGALASRELDQQDEQLVLDRAKTMGFTEDQQFTTAEFESAFNSVEGDANYRPELDITGDGKIDFEDFIRVSAFADPGGESFTIPGQKTLEASIADRTFADSKADRALKSRELGIREDEIDLQKDTALGIIDGKWTVDRMMLFGEDSTGASKTLENKMKTAALTGKLDDITTLDLMELRGWIEDNLSVPTVGKMNADTAARDVDVRASEANIEKWKDIWAAVTDTSFGKAFFDKLDKFLTDRVGTPTPPPDTTPGPKVPNLTDIPDPITIPPGDPGAIYNGLSKANPYAGTHPGDGAAKWADGINLGSDVVFAGPAALSFELDMLPGDIDQMLAGGAREVVNGSTAVYDLGEGIEMHWTPNADGTETMKRVYPDGTEQSFVRAKGVVAKTGFGGETHRRMMGNIKNAYVASFAANLIMNGGDLSQTAIDTLNSGTGIITGAMINQAFQLGTVGGLVAGALTQKALTAMEMYIADPRARGMVEKLKSGDMKQIEMIKDDDWAWFGDNLIRNAQEFKAEPGSAEWLKRYNNEVNGKSLKGLFQAGESAMVKEINAKFGPEFATGANAMEYMVTASSKGGTAGRQSAVMHAFYNANGNWTTAIENLRKERFITEDQAEQAQKRVLGDDMRFDESQLSEFSASHNSKFGQKAYKPVFDVNNDGEISFSDFILFSSKVGDPNKNATFVDAPHGPAEGDPGGLGKPSTSISKAMEELKGNNDNWTEDRVAIVIDAVKNGQLTEDDVKALGLTPKRTNHILNAARG